MTQDQCPWTIRWGTSAETTTRCTRADGHTDVREPDTREREPYVLSANEHFGQGITPGQTIHWYAGDRREYTGNWPGYCQKLGPAAFKGGCTLPDGHHGRCAP